MRTLYSAILAAAFAASFGCTSKEVAVQTPQVMPGADVNSGTPVISYGNRAAEFVKSELRIDISSQQKDQKYTDAQQDERITRVELAANVRIVQATRRLNTIEERINDLENSRTANVNPGTTITPAQPMPPLQDVRRDLTYRELRIIRNYECQLQRAERMSDSAIKTYFIRNLRESYDAFKRESGFYK